MSLQLSTLMPASEAMHLAKFQRPGAQLIVGPELAREEITPQATRTVSPPPNSWAEYDMNKRVGFYPSAWVWGFISAAADRGHSVTHEDVLFLTGASLDAARLWLESVNPDPIEI